MEMKKRSTNFTSDEVEVLLSLVEVSGEIIECKKTDSVSNSVKDAEWQKIETQFNSVCGTGRTAKMLRSKWGSLKKLTKKEYAEVKQSFHMTGGGSAVEKKMDNVGIRILGIIGLGAAGRVCQQDCDFAPDEEISIEVFDETEEEKMPECSSKSWNPQKLHQPISEVLQSVNSVTSSTAENGIGSSVIANPKETLTKFSCTLESNSTKRKRFYKKESSAEKLQKEHLQGVYMKLAERKIEYINFQMQLLKEEAEKKELRSAEKHELEKRLLEGEAENKEKRLAEKHELEIKILEAELANKINSI